ncbi:MAG TPA: DUF1801 domain-containing protein [Candidatus Pacearchaeota archaeon]|nr:DUF1801 domain-containing protein [Candidatus Parcubacteria bacterium]HOU45589.1 DUF1801 domain-containing protein [Candidatus Pacearchaeota archaeon]HQI74254.1 DUF1801 domain-containing protein [Candidatus Pacearchaeota archaeon]
MKATVEQYIKEQKSPQKEILEKLRKIILKNIKNQEEKMEWGVASYGGGKFYLVALKGRVHMGFAITGLSKEEVKLFEGSGKTARHIKIYSLNDINEEKIVKLIEMIDKKAIFVG